MRLRREVLIFRALVLLDEAVDGCHAQPIKPSLGLRLALMLLFALSRGDRGPFDGFWRTVQNPNHDAHSDSIGRYIRATSARTWMTSIARAVGVVLDADYLRELRLARLCDTERRAIREADARVAEHRRRLHETSPQPVTTRDPEQ